MRIPAGVAVLLLGASAVTACGREREKRIEAVSKDAEVLSKVNAIVNQVVRAAGDCDAVKASLPEARQRLNEAAGQLQEEGSRRVLNTLREQVDRAAEACPVAFASVEPPLVETAKPPRPFVRAVAVSLWLLLVAVPLLALAAEAALQWRWHARAERAREYRRSLPALFDARPVDEAWVESLWETRWVRYRPGARMQATLGGVEYDIAIDRHGFRTEPFEDRKPAGTLRVACLGGSTTVQGRVNALTYPGLLQAKLQPLFPGHRVEVLNLGISGARSEYWVERWGELAAWAPDVIVQYEGVNDILWRWLPRHWRQHPVQAALRHTLLASELWPIAPPALEPDFDRSASYLARLARQARRSGMAYVAGTFAAPDSAALAPGQAEHLDLNLSEWRKEPPPLRSFREYERLLLRFNERLRAPIHEAGGEVVPVAEQLRDPALFTDLCHLRPQGIARLADAFLPEVTRQLRAVVAARAREAGRPWP